MSAAPPPFAGAACVWLPEAPLPTPTETASQRAELPMPLGSRSYLARGLPTWTDAEVAVEARREAETTPRSKAETSQRR